MQTITRLLLSVLLLGLSATASAGQNSQGDNTIRHVLFISIDGMHGVDLANCTTGISTINSGNPYCPHLAALAANGIVYTQASSSKPSDSFPGLLAPLTGGSPRSTGVFYDVSYDRTLSPHGSCPGTVGTEVAYDETADIDFTQLNGGGGIDTNKLPQDPNKGCAVVFPHNYLKVNTIFEVVKAAGGYTAWADKHPTYEIVKGPSGAGVNDLFTPEINSAVVALPNVPGCTSIVDPAATDAWTSSFQNIKCYDSLKVQAIINEIDGKTHDGSAPARVPTVFGMNFQAVSVGQKLVESAISTTGGYVDALGTPSTALLGEITFVDTAIGQMASELAAKGLANSTLIIITAKHGQSPIDPASRLRITKDFAGATPSAILTSATPPTISVAQATQDDVSLLWLTHQSDTADAVAKLSANQASDASGEIIAGESLKLLFNDPLTDARTPDIIVQPDVGVIYTGSGKKIAEHGGFTRNDTNVMLLVANPQFPASQITLPVATTQIAPTILKALNINPSKLKAVQLEGTPSLPGINFAN
jgi:hypothetical protein